MTITPTVSPTSSFIATPFAISLTTSLAPMTFSNRTSSAAPESVTLSAGTKPGRLANPTRKAQQHPITLIASPHPVTTSSLNLSLGEQSSVSASTSPQRPENWAAWSPSFSRKLRWRVRQYTLWETVIFLAFVGASIVMFRALVGVGYAPEEFKPLHIAPGWHAPGSRATRHGGISQISASEVIDSFLRFTGLGPRNSIKDDDGLKEEMDLEPPSRGGRHYAHERPRFDTWQRFRHRMVRARARTPHTKQRSPIHHDVPNIIPPPASPHHHQRVQEPSVSLESSVMEEDEGGASLTRPEEERDEDDRVADSPNMANRVEETKASIESDPAS